MKSKIITFFTITSLLCFLLVLTFYISQRRPTSKQLPTTHSLKLQYPVSFLHGKDILKSTSQLSGSQWMKELKLYLQHRTSRLILLVIANQKFENVLFNWLASASAKGRIPLEDILIITTDGVLHQTLLQYNIRSIHIGQEQIIRPSAKLHTLHSHFWIIRCTVARILNHWGFDVLMFDIDAVILKDLRELFKENLQSDIVASQGKYPFELNRKWGATLCMGVVLFRSTPSTELFWSIAHEIKPNVQDDQVKVNHILYHNNINWYTSPQCKDIHHCTLTGVTTNITLTVTLLSQDIICRSCDRNGHYYVKHIASSRTSSSKESKAKKKGTWFLSKNWKERIRNSNLTGNDLLLSLANTNTGITDNNK